MKTLSGRQPWWWAILHGGKRIDNRRWNTHYRGRVLLHAAKGATPGEYREALEWMIAAGVATELTMPHLLDMPRGGIVGRARICKVIPKGLSPDLARELVRDLGVDIRWWMPDQYGFVLDDVDPLTFHPCNGALGLWEFDERRLGLTP